MPPDSIVVHKRLQLRPVIHLERNVEIHWRHHKEIQHHLRRRLVRDVNLKDVVIEHTSEIPFTIRFLPDEAPVKGSNIFRAVPKVVVWFMVVETAVPVHMVTDLGIDRTDVQQHAVARR
jgi:hypothetical protein